MYPTFVNCYQIKVIIKAVFSYGAACMPYKAVQLLIVLVYQPPLLLRVRISSTGCKVFGVPGSSSVGVTGSLITKIEKQGHWTINKPFKKVF